LDFFLANVSIVSSKFSCLTSSDSIDNTVYTETADKRFCFIVVPSSFLILFKQKNDLSPEALATRNDRNNPNAVSTLGNVAQRLFSTKYCCISIAFKVLDGFKLQNCKNSYMKVSSKSVVFYFSQMYKLLPEPIVEW